MRRNEFDAEADFRETDRADIEEIERLRGDKGHDLGLGSRAAELGQNVRIKEPSRHSAASRTGIGPRRDSISMSRWGEAWSASIRAAPPRSPLRR